MSIWRRLRPTAGVKLGRPVTGGIGRLNPLVRPITLSGGQLNHHVQVVGASGFGKTVLLQKILKHKICQGGGLLFVDLKCDREMMDGLSDFATANGRAADVLRFSIAPGSPCAPYNLLAHGSATELRDRLMVGLTWSEEYYKSVSSSHLLKILKMYCFLRQQDGFEFGLHEVLRGLSEPEYLEGLYRQMESPPVEIDRLARDAFDALKKKDYFEALQGARSQIEGIVYSDFGARLQAGLGGIDLRSAYLESKIVLISLDSRRFADSSRVVGKFILQDLKSTSAFVDSEVNSEDRRSFLVMIDEFADLATPDFISFLDRARSSKMEVVVAHQELADLERVENGFARRLMGNTSTTIAFLQKGPESAELICKVAGTRSTWKPTYQIQDSFFGFRIRTGQGSLREVEEFVVHPNVLKRLPVGRCVVIKKYPKAEVSIVQVQRG